MAVDDYNPGSSLAAYFPSRDERRVARLWAREKTLHDLADLGAVDFFEGGGSDPTVLPGYAADKLWLRVDPGVTDAPGTVRYYVGGDATLLASWPELDRVGFSTHSLPTAAAVTAAAAASAAAAAASAAEVQLAAEDVAAAILNLPDITPGTAGRRIQVNAAETGFTLPARKKRMVLCLSQSNIANSASIAWAPRTNHKLWNGGYWNGFVASPNGTAFAAAPSGTVSVGLGFGDGLAARYADDDIHQVIVAHGGSGVRSFVGMRYVWKAATSGDPGTGGIGFDSSAPGSIAQLRMSETDAEGYTRYLGASTMQLFSQYPARIEVVGNESQYIEFSVTSTYTDAGTYRTYTVAHTASASWPPADGTAVRVFEADARMRDALTANVEAAMTAAGLTGADRVFDHILLWPTESDINYTTSYEAVDFPRLMTALAPYIAPERTELTFTLPWPYGAGLGFIRDRWWDVVRQIVSADSQRRLVSLSDSSAASWDAANNYVHVANAGMLPIGRRIAGVSERGGSAVATVGYGKYTPTITGVANVDSFIVYAPFRWSRNGSMIRVTGLLGIDATAASLTLTTVRIALPVASDLLTVADVIGGMTSESLANQAGYIKGDTTNNEAAASMWAGSTGMTSWYVQFDYEVISA